jgi:hypothetical protein
MKKLTTDGWQSGRIPGMFGAAFAIWACYTILGFGLIWPAQASIYLVTTNNPSGPGSLSNALAQAQGDSGAVINFQTNLGVITVAGMLPQIQNNLVLNGNSNVVSGGGLNRIFFINAPTGTVLINSLTLEHGSVRGGSGGIGTGGGGGGAGLGGAIFLNSGNLTVANLVFLTNSATGGDGGLGWQFTDTPAGGGGGGGGLDFIGGNGFGGSTDGGMTYQGPGGGGGALTSAGGNGTADTIGGGNGGGVSGGMGGANQLVSGNALTSRPATGAMAGSAAISVAAAAPAAAIRAAAVSQAMADLAVVGAAALILLTEWRIPGATADLAVAVAVAVTSGI